VKPGQHVILMGAQGAGKGTQAGRLAPSLNLVHFSTGDAFRAAISAQTELGVLAKGYLDRGDLVPDDVTIGIVADKLQEITEGASGGGPGGALFDGFPRTRAQAEGLDNELAKRNESIAAVVEIDVPRADLIERLSGRRVCPECGTVYHVKFHPPKVAGICDNDGTVLEQRKDDAPEAIERRLNLYDEQTQPLLAYYRERGLLASVDGRKSADEVERDILGAISSLTGEGR
jgi:adenylate kinase